MEMNRRIDHFNQNLAPTRIVHVYLLLVKRREVLAQRRNV